MFFSLSSACVQLARQSPLVFQPCPGIWSSLNLAKSHSQPCGFPADVFIKHMPGVFRRVISTGTCSQAGRDMLPQPPPHRLPHSCCHEKLHLISQAPLGIENPTVQQPVQVQNVPARVSVYIALLSSFPFKSLQMTREGAKPKKHISGYAIQAQQGNMNNYKFACETGGCKAKCLPVTSKIIWSIWLLALG